MRKIFYALLALPLLSVQPALAGDGDNLVVKTKSGAKEASLDNVQKIVFSGDSMSVVLKSGTDTYAFEDISSIAFGTTTGIEPVVAGKGTESKLLLHVLQDGNTLSVSGWTPGHAANVEIYTVGGALSRTVKGWSGSNIDVASLPKGTYIIKIGDKGAKFIK